MPSPDTEYAQRRTAAERSARPAIKRAGAEADATGTAALAGRPRHPPRAATGALKATRRRRRRPVSVVVGTLLTGTLLLTIAGLVKMGTGAVPAVFDAAFQTPASFQAATGSVWQALHLGVLNPWYWAFLGILSAAQWCMPARRDQRSPAVELAVDAVWFVMGNVMRVTVVAVSLGAVTVAYQQFLGTWSLNLQPLIGLWGLAVVAFVITDMLAWVSHWCHHVVATLWRFHAVHHAQQNLNALSDNKQHVGETVCAALIVFVPSQLLGLNADAAGALTFVMIYYSAMLHSNIRTNFGPLKYVLMSPQAHRIHHSILSQHYNSNFATVFSFWDYAARTRYHGNDEYPPTGIDDAGFPLERPSLNPLRWLATWWMQTLYPFQAMVKSRRRRQAKVHGRPEPTRTPLAAQRLEEEAELRAIHRLAELHRASDRARATRAQIALPPMSAICPAAPKGPQMARVDGTLPLLMRRVPVP